MEAYKLRTIKDIFDKIPTKRLADCMTELEQLVRQTQITRDGLDRFFGSKGVSEFPDEVVWKDDGEGSIKTDISVNGKPMASVEFKMSEHD